MHSGFSGLRTAEIQQLPTHPPFAYWFVNMSAFDDKIDQLYQEVITKARKQAAREAKAISLRQHDLANDANQVSKHEFKKAIQSIIEQEIIGDDESLNAPELTYGRDDHSANSNPNLKPEHLHLVRRATRNSFRYEMRDKAKL